MKYVGQRSESEAAHYRDKRYSHSTFSKGKEVKWYDCWVNDDKAPPVFKEDDLQIDKVRQVDRIFRDNPDFDVPAE